MIDWLAVVQLPFESFTLQQANTLVGVTGGICSICATVYATVRAVIRRRRTGGLEESERSYLNSLEQDLDKRNRGAQFDDLYYIDPNIEASIPLVTPRFTLARPADDEGDIERAHTTANARASSTASYPSLRRALKSSQSKAHVVLGDPGSGKSVALRRFAKQATAEALKGKSEAMPIFYELRTYTDTKRDGTPLDIEDAIRLDARRSYKNLLIGKRLDDVLGRGALVFLDALDELPRDATDRAARLASIKNFVDKWPSSTFILSCRSLDYDQDLSFNEIYIRPFTMRRVRDYATKLLRRRLARQFWQKLKSSPQLLALASSPFYLNLLAHYFLDERDLPPNKADLFRVLIHNFILREKQKTNSTRPELTADRFDEVIGELAYFMSQARKRKTVLIDDFVSTLPEGEQESARRLVSVATSGGLLDLYESGSGQSVGFQHHRFEEYFAALALRRRLDADIDGIPDVVFTNVWWREKVLLLASLASNRDGLVARILAADESIRGDEVLDAARRRFDLQLLALQCCNILADRSVARPCDDLRVELAEKVRATGTSLSKVRLLRAMSNDHTEVASRFIDDMARDDSSWVSETSIAARSMDGVRVPMRTSAAFAELGRLFLQGRILTMLPSLMRGMTSRRPAHSTAVVVAAVPLALLSVAAIAIYAWVLLYILAFLVFRLDHSLTLNCLVCVAQSLAVVGGTGYFVVRGRRRYIENAFRAFPVAVLGANLMFSPTSALARFLLAMMSYGTGFVVYRWSGAKRSSADSLYWPVVVALLVANVGVALMSSDIFLLSAIGVADAAGPLSGLGQGSPGPIRGLEALGDVFASSRAYRAALVVGFVVLGIGVLVPMYIGLRRRQDVHEVVQRIQNHEGSVDDLAVAVGKALSAIRYRWGQTRVVAAVRSRYGGEPEKRLKVMRVVARQASSDLVRDVAFQMVDEDERAYRRIVDEGLFYS